MDRADDNKQSDEKVHCRRLQVERSVDEHLGCAYCFGKRAQVAEGDRHAFCDFEPGVDPINFGFPDDSGRLANG